ncbi:MAG: 50S ribosomal protein L9 [Bacteroidetes bacterium QS_8_68_28]|jgi:large subunit ribosomal protein L9|nr:MAG: 50S ribosomal protein L9 [Bacteroidetes bacterium QS_8_68_28]
MNVILLEDVEHLGRRGDLAEVADGYGRNYLIPQQKARLATEGAIKALEEEERQAAARRAQSREEAQELAEELEDLLVVVSARVSDDDKIYGSVTPQQVSVELSERDYEIDRRDIELEEDPIRRLGVYTATVEVHDGVTADLKVQVMPEG